MSVPETPSINYHPYSHALQIRVYQAFIFSIPVLFSIILFLLFYLFYLKRRAYALSSSPPSTFNYATSFLPMPHHIMGLKGDLKDKLPKVVFDEDLKARDSVCCVCLGEFEINEELIQVQSCKHMFHKDCIHHWLQSNSTCPLCRCCVFLALDPISLPPNMHLTQGTTFAAETTTTTTTDASSSSSGSIDCSSNNNNQGVPSGLSVVIHVQPQ